MEDHAGDFVAYLIDEVKLGAEGAPLACEIAHGVDATEEAEAVHPFIQVAYLLCALGGDGFWGFVC